MNKSLHPSAPHHLPGFVTAPGDTDILMVVVGNRPDRCRSDRR
ncbi:hypothetical protein [Bradyrhizobium valentinum]|nr:hypothetical protein [Bradyrhizobium valentinum]